MPLSDVKHPRFGPSCGQLPSHLRDETNFKLNFMLRMSQTPHTDTVDDVLSGDDGLASMDIGAVCFTVAESTARILSAAVSSTVVLPSLIGW